MVVKISCFACYALVCVDKLKMALTMTRCFNTITKKGDLAQAVLLHIESIKRKYRVSKTPYDTECI